MVGVVVREVPELLGLVEAPLQVLRGHVVLSHLDAVVDVPNLNKKHLYLTILLRNKVIASFYQRLLIVFP